MKRLMIVIAAGALALAACGDDDGGGVREIGDGGSASESGSGSDAGSASGSESGSASGAAPECEPVGGADDADTTVAVELLEYEILVDPAEAPAGSVHFAIDNTGTEPHELVVVSGVAPADLPLDPDGALDEAALPEGALIGEVEAFPGGETCDGTFELDPGSYTLVCNLVDEAVHGHEAHLAEGMVTEFVVAG